MKELEPVITKKEEIAAMRYIVQTLSDNNVIREMEKEKIFSLYG